MAGLIIAAQIVVPNFSVRHPVLRLTTVFLTFQRVNFMKRLFLLIIAGTVAAIAPSVQAGLLQTSTASFSHQKTELNGAPILTLEKYHGSGTLDSVVVSYQQTLSTSGTVTNNAAQPQSFTFLVQAFKYDLSKAPGAPAVLPTAFKTFTTGETLGDYDYTDLAAGASAPFGPFSVTHSGSSTYTALSQMSQFVGAGTFSFSPKTLIAQTFIGGGGNVAASLDTYADATMTVDYYGTVIVPEPSTIVFSGSSAVLLGMGWLLKRRRRLAA